MTAPPPGFEHAFVALEGGRRAHWVRGPRNGPPLVLLPGLMDPWSGFAAVAPPLAERFWVHLVSLAGHGPSSPTADGRYAVPDYGRDVAALLADAFDEPACISGNSLGGLIALWLAVHHPRRVRAICLEDAPLFITEAPAWDAHWMRPGFARVVEAMEAAQGDVEALAARIAAMPVIRPKVHATRQERARTLERLRRLLGPAASEPRLAQAWAAYEEEGRQPAVADFYPAGAAREMALALSEVDVNAPREVVQGRLNTGFGHADHLARVRQPALVMEADRLLSGIVEPALFDEACRLLGRHERRAYADGAGHLVHLDAPGWFAQALADFFLQEAPAA